MVIVAELVKGNNNYITGLIYEGVSFIIVVINNAIVAGDKFR